MLLALLPSRDIILSVLAHSFQNIFLVNQNHFGLPNQLWKITNGQLMTEGLYHEITLTKQKKLNLDDMPCEENPSYSLND